MFSRPGNLLSRCQDITIAFFRDLGITWLCGWLCSIVQWPQGIPSVINHNNTGIDPCVSKAASSLWRPRGTISHLFSLMFDLCALTNHASNEWQCRSQVLPWVHHAVLTFPVCRWTAFVWSGSRRRFALLDNPVPAWSCSGSRTRKRSRRAQFLTRPFGFVSLQAAVRQVRLRHQACCYTMWSVNGYEQSSLPPKSRSVLGAAVTFIIITLHLIAKSRDVLIKGYKGIQPKSWWLWEIIFLDL